MWYALLILYNISLSSCELLFSKGTLQNPLDLFLFPVEIKGSFYIMWTFVSVKNSLHTASHFFLVDINKQCNNLAVIWPSLSFLGSWGNSNIHSSFDIILPLFGRPTVIGGLLTIFFPWASLGLI